MNMDKATDRITLGQKMVRTYRDTDSSHEDTHAIVQILTDI